MKRWLVLLAGALVVCACWSNAARANPCCWDVSTDAGIQGVGDVPGYPHNPKAGSAVDPPNAPNGWAQCTQTAAADCFKRRGIQEIWYDRICEIGSAAPNGDLSAAPNGYRCIKKSQPGVLVAHVYKFPWDATYPADQGPGPSGKSQEARVYQGPGASQASMLVLVLLLLTAGGWILIRGRAARTVRG